MNDTQHLLGQVLTAIDHQRDAVHIAVAPMIAGETMHPGQRIGLAFGSTTVARRRHLHTDYGGIEPIGIVDPFLTEAVEEGQRFWMFLLPNTVTGMRHEWAHPAFTAQAPVSSPEAWLRDFADRWNMDYDQMVEEAQDKDGYAIARGVDLHSAGELGSDEALFWSNLEALTGKQFNAEHRTEFGWSCSC